MSGDSPARYRAKLSRRFLCVIPDEGDQRLDRSPESFGPSPAKHGFGVRIPVENGSIALETDDGLRCGVKDVSGPQLALPRQRLSLFVGAPVVEERGGFSKDECAMDDGPEPGIVDCSRMVIDQVRHPHAHHAMVRHDRDEPDQEGRPVNARAIVYAVSALLSVVALLAASALRSGRDGAGAGSPGFTRG